MFNVLLSASIAVNIFMACNLQYLWSLMNTIQLIVHEPMLSVRIPAEPSFLLQLLLEVIKFKIIPVNKIFGVVNEKSSMIGYDPDNMIKNIAICENKCLKK